MSRSVGAWNGSFDSGNNRTDEELSSCVGSFVVLTQTPLLSSDNNATAQVDGAQDEVANEVGPAGHGPTSRRPFSNLRRSSSGPKGFSGGEEGLRGVSCPPLTQDVLNPHTHTHQLVAGQNRAQPSSGGPARGGGRARQPSSAAMVTAGDHGPQPAAFSAWTCTDQPMALVGTMTLAMSPVPAS